jgi:hypothetical protein
MANVRSAALFHGVVLMGISLAGGSFAACGGVATSPLSFDGGNEATPEGSTDGYPMIGFFDGYPTIHPDGYPTIGIHDSGQDTYPTIHPDGYPTIGIDSGADHYVTIGPPPLGDA